MRKAGYEIVVPYQKIPWCYHDGGWKSSEKSFAKEEAYRDIAAELRGLLQKQKFSELNDIAENLQDLSLIHI